MRILFLKGTAADAKNPLSLHKKLILIFRQRVKEAATDEDRAREQRRLDQVEATPEEESNSDDTSTSPATAR